MALITATWDGVLSNTIDGLYINRITRGGYGSVRDVDVDIPGRDGAWHFTENRGLRDIEMDVTLVADSPALRHAKVVEFADWLDKTGRRKLVFSDQSDRYWMAALTSDIRVDEWGRLGKASVSWSAEPYAYAVTTTEVCFTAASGADTDSFVAADTIEAYPEVRLVPSGGALTSVSWTLNDDTISWSGITGEGSTLTISSISDTVLGGQSGDTDLTGAFDIADLDMSAVSGDFGLIRPGTNVWSITTTGTFTSLQICIEWRRRYR